MSRESDVVHQAIHRWEDASLIDADTARRLREEVARESAETTRRLSQYMLATTGAVVLVIAGWVFLDWAWPLLSVRVRAICLAVAGVGATVLGVSFEDRYRWRPAAYLVQTAGLGLLLSAFSFTDSLWDDQSFAQTVTGFFALVIPVVLAPRSMRRNVIMPAVHLTAGLAFLAIFLDRATSLSGDASIWVLDLALVGAIVVLARLILRDPGGDSHPWALNAFVAAMAAGFVLVSVTAFEVFDLSDEGLLAVDFWLALTAALTLWGIHRAPPGLRRAWFGQLLVWMMLSWIVLGLATAFETFNGPPELGVVLVGGVGVAAFLYADRRGLQALMGAASLSFIVPLWWWAVDRGGALGGAAALVATAGFLFWASGRRGSDEAADSGPMVGGIMPPGGGSGAS